MKNKVYFKVVEAIKFHLVLLLRRITKNIYIYELVSGLLHASILFIILFTAAPDNLRGAKIIIWQ